MNNDNIDVLITVRNTNVLPTILNAIISKMMLQIYCVTDTGIPLPAPNIFSVANKTNVPTPGRPPMITS